jgi:UDP-glucuronate decarboxylase
LPPPVKWTSANNDLGISRRKSIDADISRTDELHWIDAWESRDHKLPISVKSVTAACSGTTLTGVHNDMPPKSVDRIDNMGDLPRVLVTGGAGFLGSHLTKRLLSVGHEVLVADNYSSSTGSNLDDVRSHRRLTVLRHDVAAPLYVDVDQIYHLACPASPVYYQRDPVQTIKTCVHGSTNMLGLARRTGASILLTSTSEVYGDPDVHPQPEGYRGNVNPIGARSCYDEGKRCAEALFFSYRMQHDLPIKVARIFNTYGPNMQPDDGRVVSNFIVQALRGLPLQVFGDGTQTRSFCYVDDLVDGLVRLMNTPHEVTGPINLGNPGEFTMLELAKLVLDVVGSDSAIDYGSLPLDDPKRRCPAIDQAKQVLGWQPSTELADGLTRTVEYFRRAGV